MTSSSRGDRLVVAGVVMLIAAVVSAAGLWRLGVERERDAVAGLARGPAPCALAVGLTAAKQYVVYLETVSRVAEVDGSCPVAPGVIRHQETSVGAPVTVTVTPADGSALHVGATVAKGYSTGGFAGRAIAEFAASTPGMVRITATGAAADTVLAIGRADHAPAHVRAVAQVAGERIGVASAITGLALIGVGKRRARRARMSLHLPGAATWQPPTGPPARGLPPPPAQGSG